MSTHSKLIRNLFFITLFFIAGDAIIRLYTSKDDTMERLSSSSLNGSSYPNINHFNMVFKDNSVILNVFLDNPAPCALIEDELHIQDIVVNTRIYKPTCKVINPKLLKITYKTV